MAQNTQRLSQLVSTFGPGAMVDLPTRSVVIAGLEHWDMRANGSAPGNPFKEQNRLDETKRLALRTPPVSDGIGEREGVSAPSSQPGSCARGWTVRGTSAGPAATACLLARPRRQRPATLRIRRRHESDRRPLRLRLRKGPPPGHRLALGHPRQHDLQRTDVGGGEGGAALVARPGPGRLRREAEAAHPPGDVPRPDGAPRAGAEDR